MAELTIEEIKAKILKANGDYHDAIDKLMVSKIIYVDHKVAVASMAEYIFKMMAKVNDFPLAGPV
jgi:hypothetical protein